MKHNYLILIALISFTFSQAQIVNIPDANFKNALVNTNCVDVNGDGVGDLDADTNDDGEIQVSEAETVLNLLLPGAYITNFDGIQHFQSLESLDVSSSNSISGLDLSGNVNLKKLNTSNNGSYYLDLSNNIVLEELICNNSGFNNFDVTNNPELKKLDCSNIGIPYLDLSQNNLLTHLNVSQNPLEDLDLSNNLMLEELIRYSTFYLGDINLTNNNNLKKLDLRDSQVTQLDVSNMEFLEVLFCSQNNLTSLDVSNNPRLLELAISINPIGSIDISQNPLLEKFYAIQNDFTTIDISQNTLLETLYISAVNIQMLDLSSNVNLIDLSIRDSQIESLNLNNCSVLEWLVIRNNSALEVVYLKNGVDFSQNFSIELNGNSNLNYICSDDFNNDFIQNLIDNEGLTNCEINTYCSFNPGGTYYTVQGNSRFDLNNDGCDNNDEVVPMLNFYITDQNQELFSVYIPDVNGNHSIPVLEGTYNITPLFETPNYYQIYPEFITVNFPTESSPFNQDFCVMANGIHNDLEIVIIPVEEARPGFDTDYKIIYKNKGNTVMSNSLEFSYNENAGLMELVSSTPVADTHVGNVLTWSFTDLMPFETREILVTMNLNSPTDTPPLNGGDYLGFVANIFPIADDELVGDNNFQLKQVVVNSFDPNDKTCLQGETIEPEDVGKYVHYLIRFENTGTASAVNIVVKDEIDMTKYDVSTLIPLDGSHDFVTRIKDDNIVEFIFEDINLPFDDANNDGYVLFKIKTLETLVLGDTFSNDAEIYFDYNAPIITNDEMTTVAENLSVEETELQNLINIYPNPASDVINIESRINLESITVYDVHGRQIVTQLTSANQTQINVSQLSKGVYFLNIETTDGEQTSKFVKK